MDRASQALAEAFSADQPRTYRAVAEKSNVPRSTLHRRKHGGASKETKAQRQQYLAVEEEKALVLFLLLMSSFGQPVRIKYVPTLAFSIAHRRSTTTNKPIKPPGKNWARAFEKRHPELKARRVKSIDWKRHENNIYDKTVEWFQIIGKVLQNAAVLPENVYNIDETGVMLSKLGSVKVLVGKDDRRDYRGAGMKRTMVTAVECISADGRALPPLIIWPASTHRSNWTTYPTPGWHYGFSESSYNDSKISLEWLIRVFDPQTRDLANGKPRVLICDGFGTHETLEVLEFCLCNNIMLCRLPSHTSHKLQLCDVGVFAPLKTAYRDQVERLNRGGINIVGKEHFTSLYDPARTKAFTRRNIKAAWAASGLLPFNPERVLQDMPRPPAELTVSIASEVMPSDPGDEIPVTPVTPVNTEGLVSLHDLIKQDTSTLDEPSKQRLQRRVQKLASAAQISFAKQGLLQDHNRLLAKINGEAKVRRATRSVVLGKAKVMSYEDLEEARAKRAAKEKVVAERGKAKRGRKREVAQPDSYELEPTIQVARMSEVVGPWRAPVARMY
ncbi:hypothetical protein GGP41_007835 [Bipolaris sorokiniana]|uniref:HTH CENPB-type domain-containing protein n=1 Tax=Cochliobolus sativus TaxID=45130 RepID=A0A8H5ZRC4_COCSA|nr:hypothetical protein GGP41_007835 [Bipolaris sorokiniana]